MSAMEKLEVLKGSFACRDRQAIDSPTLRMVANWKLGVIRHIGNCRLLVNYKHQIFHISVHQHLLYFSYIVKCFFNSI
jgi:hypothetical protein